MNIRPEDADDPLFNGVPISTCDLTEFAASLRVVEKSAEDTDMGYAALTVGQILESTDGMKLEVKCIYGAGAHATVAGALVISVPSKRDVDPLERLPQLEIGDFCAVKVHRADDTVRDAGLNEADVIVRVAAAAADLVNPPAKVRATAGGPPPTADRAPPPAIAIYTGRKPRPLPIASLAARPFTLTTGHLVVPLLAFLCSARAVLDEHVAPPASVEAPPCRWVVRAGRAPGSQVVLRGSAAQAVIIERLRAAQRAKAQAAAAATAAAKLEGPATAGTGAVAGGAVVGKLAVATAPLGAHARPPAASQPAAAGGDASAAGGAGVRFSLAAVGMFTLDLVAAVAAVAAAGYVHTDIKPHNVLVSFDATRAVLADFGVAQRTSQLAALSSDAVGGSVQARWYRAPEVVVRAAPYGPQIDVWAVACTAFEMYTAAVLFEGATNADVAALMAVACGPWPGRLTRGGAVAAALFGGDAVSIRGVSADVARWCAARRGEADGGVLAEEAAARNEAPNQPRVPRADARSVAARIHAAAAADPTATVEVAVSASLLKGLAAGRPKAELRGGAGRHGVRDAVMSRQLPLFVDFLETALVLDPYTRPSAAELLSHPFVATASVFAQAAQMASLMG